jgi:hypothetical protein
VEDFNDEAAFSHRTGGFILNEEGTSMKRSVLLVAVLTLVVGAAGQARGDMIISAQFQGLSNQGAYGLQTGHPVPISPFPIQAGFTYSDNGTATTLSVYFGRLGHLPPGPNYDFDTLDDVTLRVPDSVRAAWPGNPIDSEFKIGQDRTLTLNFNAFEITSPASRPFVISGAVGVAFSLKGTVHLLPDNTVDPSSIDLNGFTGGEFANIGGPLTQLVPEPSTLALIGTAGITALGYFGWRRRKLAAA